MMNEGAEMQMNQSGALDSHEMEQEEINNRSIFVGNVDYSTQPEELQSLFSECGLINRVTILVNKNTGHSKGYAYIEFADASSVRTALSLSESFFKKRQIKVCSKRRNIPGFNRPKISPFRGRSMKTSLGPRGTETTQLQTLLSRKRIIQENRYEPLRAGLTWFPTFVAFSIFFKGAPLASPLFFKSPHRSPTRWESQNGRQRKSLCKKEKRMR
ncbi:RNA-binding protein, partial [Plasmodium cynomolgi strain B]